MATFRGPPNGNRTSVPLQWTLAREDANRAAKYRNAFAHALKMHDKEKEWIHEVAYLCDFLQAVIELSLLRCIGFNDAMLDTVLGRNWQIRYLPRVRTQTFASS
jgi:hypothetical protein